VARGSVPLVGSIRNVDFFDVKGVVEEFCATFRIEADFIRPNERLAAGRAAEVRVRSNGATSPLGVLGQIHPAVAELRGFPVAEETYVAEIDLDALAGIAAGDDLRARPLPRFPSIVRDVSILVDEALPAAAVRGTIRSAAPASLESIVEFDRYHGTGVPEGRVSLSLRLTFRAPDRTLTDEEAQQATEGIVRALGQA
jgi:phenylalanyl-tRNA synthetase beta chain